MQQTTMKDFEMIKKLGSGSFSTVYKVRRKEDNKIYALKQVKMNMLSSKEKENALNEIRILVLGLNELHSLNIFHRDMKCANIFMNKNICKLGDFNVSKFSKNAFASTQAGTPYYCSPEIWKGQKYTMKCDIWSLGCIIYEIAMFMPPFQATSMERLSRTVQRGVFMPITSQRYSKDLQQFIQNCLNVNPGQRPSAADLLDHPLLQQSLDQFSDSQSMDQSEKQVMLKTIKLTRNLRDLGNQLPKPKYAKIVENYLKHNENNQEKDEEQKEKKEEKKLPEKVVVKKILQDNIQLTKNVQNQIIYKPEKPQEEIVKKDLIQIAQNPLPPQIPKQIENNQNNKLPLIHPIKNNQQYLDKEYFDKINQHHRDYLAKIKLPPHQRYRSSSQKRNVNISIDHKQQPQPETPQRVPRQIRVLSANNRVKKNLSQDYYQQKISPLTPSNSEKIKNYLAGLQQQKQVEQLGQKRRVSLGKQIIQNF